MKLHHSQTTNPATCFAEFICRLDHKFSCRTPRIHEITPFSNLRRKEQERINQIAAKYNEFSRTAGLPTKTERMSAGGYHRVKTAGELKKSLTKGVGSDKVSTGAFSGAKKTSGWEDRHATLMYDEIRKRTTDVSHIASHTPFTEKAIGEIKAHLFTEKHLFEDGTTRVFDADFEQAQAWDRLSQGRGTTADLVLLKHEYVELTQMRIHGYPYEVAHCIANEKHCWSKVLIEEAKKP